jgi:hypothetical protein
VPPRPPPPTFEPASLLPVSVTAAIRGSWMIFSTRELSISSAWTHPSAARPPEDLLDRQAHPVTLLACFRTITLPAISAGAACRISCHSGKFHGMIARIGPSGSNAT